MKTNKAARKSKRIEHGIAHCTTPIKSTAKTVDEIIDELRHTTVAERAGRAQDEGRGMELLRKDGYM